MKRGMIVAGLCAGMWLGGAVWGQETVVTNLLVEGTLRQGTNALAVGTQSSAFGAGAMADGDYSHAEGDTTTASGTASHAEGALTIAGGDQSHAEGEATEALAVNSHAGGAYARVRAQDSNAFIHATGTASSNGMKETQFPDAAHFDHLVTLAPALNVSNAVLSRAENDQRYLQSGTAITVSAVRVMGNTSEATGAAVAGGSGNMAGENAFVGSGTGNLASNSWAAIGGGGGNTASGVAAFVGAGGQNSAVGSSAFVGAGSGNIAAGSYCTFVGAGVFNTVYADYSAIVGGYKNFVSNLTAYSFIGGGYSNYLAGRGYSVIGGGWGNMIMATNTGPTGGRASFIGGGLLNKITGPCASILGGHANFVGGQYGAALGGRSNVVAGSYGVAGGYGAQALHDGSWVWADAHAEPFASIASNEFAIRAAGGLRLEGRNSVGYDPAIGTNQYALWVRNFGATPGDARGLLVTTPEYNGGTGIIFHAASKAGSSMASRFIVGTDGNVGVGVNDPQSRLHVAGDARISGTLLMMDGQNIISPNFNPNTWGSGFDAWGPNAYLKYGFVRELLVAQNSDFQGKVKIGTSSDYAILNVGAPTNLVTPTYAARFESALGANSDKARGLLINFPNTTNPSSILFHAMSGAGPYTNSRVVIKADGKVGIGTSYPEATLHVHGDLLVDGAFIGDGSGLTNVAVTIDDSNYAKLDADNTFTGNMAVDGGITVQEIYAVGGNITLEDGLTVNRDSIIFSGATSSGELLMGNETNLIVGTRQLVGDWEATSNLTVGGILSGDGSGLTNLPVTGLTTNAADARYVNVSGDAMTGTLSVAGGISSEGITLTRSGTANLSMGNDGDYPVLRNAHSEIWFGTPGDRSLWFNYAAGTNVYFGDINNSQNVRIFGNVQVDGTLHGDGSGLTNLPVTGLTTNVADVRYVNTTGDAMTGALDLGRQIMTNVVGIYGQNSNDVSDLIIMAGGKTNAGSVGGGALILSGGWTGYGDTYAPVNVRSRLQTPQLVVGQVFGTSSGSSGNNLTVEAGAGYSSTNFGGILCLAGGRGNYGATPGWIRLDSRMDANGQTISNALFVGNGSGLTNVTATVDDSNYAKLDEGNEFTEDMAIQGDVEVEGSGRFAGGIRVPQQGDISMGQFTNGTF